jgi:AcrR family transcriptional regulator
MAPRRKPGNADTAARILDSAERLVQSRGFNGFSYADVAAELGVTTTTSPARPSSARR